MQRSDGRLRLSPTDITRHVQCPHVTTLDLAVLDGQVEAPAQGIDEQLQLIFARGLAHEEGYLAALQEQGRGVVTIPERAPGDRDGSGRRLSLAQREELTLRAMRDGADVVYQAVLCDDSWVGFADFLLRVDGRPSGLGDWSYDIADAKLARRLKVPALLQMAAYATRLEQLQGARPEQLVVVTGDRAEHPWRLEDVESYARRIRQRLVTAVQDPAPTQPVPCGYCAQCRWRPRCQAQWEAADDLSLVAGMRSDHRLALIDAGVSTVAMLALAPAEQLAGLSRATGERLRSQAALQVRERETGEPAYLLLPAQPGRGLQLLPEPDPGDVYLDFEGDPFAEDGVGREYLAGLLTRDGEFHDWWAHDAAEEKVMVRHLLGWLVRRWQQHPGMHVYHYASYEQAALKRLTGRYAVAETELDMLLRGERFVDLYAVVRQGLQVSKESYSIKKLEAFYWQHTRQAEADEVGDALTSVVEYERWLAGGRTEQLILDEIRKYNRVDVESTLALHDWLEARREELAHETAELLLRPVGKPQAEATDSETIAAENDLAAGLHAAGRPLLAGCLGWHRREEKSGWWEYYRTPGLSDEELVEDGSLIGQLGAPVEVGVAKQSIVWRYPFPPQEVKLSVGSIVEGVDLAPEGGGRPGAGTVVALDPEAGWVELKRAKNRPPLRPRGLGPRGPLSSILLRESLMRTGTSVLQGHAGLATALLDRAAPTDLAPRPGESATDAMVRAGSALSGQVLAVQGPPGAGKTFGGARLIRSLLDAGLRVGVTALSHAVIDNLLDKVGRPAVRKVSANDVPKEQHGPVRLAGTEEEILAALAPGGERLVGGTGWLWAREGLAEAVDVLVIDEAGQFSLAMALSVAPAARSMVLLGDPQQLTQPSNATHPDGSGVSVLEHMLDGEETIRPDQGIFLDRTYRMHPAITEFVSGMSYAGRLASAEGLEVQAVDGVPGPAGSGIRWVPAEHEGFSSDNPEEAQQVADLTKQLLDGWWTDARGVRAPLTPGQILVVAPYNAHVERLRRVLPAGVRAGTVDKFQGQQGAVVIYSMASSSAADAPRGVGFLYDTHRLNVAVSRAKALAVIVGSPALLGAPVHTPEQLRSVNALCRFVDLAGAQAAVARG